MEGLARKLLRLAPDVGRHVLAYVLWLLLLPLLTSLLFQAYALPSLADAPVLLFNRCLPLLPPVPKQHARPAGGQDGLPFVLASTIGGWVLCGAIGAMSLAGLGLRDAVLQQARALFESDEEEEQEGEQDAGAAVEGAAAVPPPPQPVAQAFGGGMGLDAPVEEWIPLDFREAVGLQGPLTVRVLSGLLGRAVGYYKPQTWSDAPRSTNKPPPFRPSSPTGRLPPVAGDAPLPRPLPDSLPTRPHPPGPPGLGTHAPRRRRGRPAALPELWTGQQRQ